MPRSWKLSRREVWAEWRLVMQYYEHTVSHQLFTPTIAKQLRGGPFPLHGWENEAMKGHMVSIRKRQDVRQEQGPTDCANLWHSASPWRATRKCKPGLRCFTKRQGFLCCLKKQTGYSLIAKWFKFPGSGNNIGLCIGYGTDCPYFSMGGDQYFQNIWKFPYCGGLK